jgi:hypothetical protein
MAVPSSGEISLQRLSKELLNDDYYAGGTFNTNVSLTEMSTFTGAFSGESLNTNNATADRPDGSTPHSAAEFYSYDHDKTSGLPSAPATGFYEVLYRYDEYLYTGDWQDYNPDNPDPIIRDYNESNFPNGKESRWRAVSIPIPSLWKNYSNLRITPYVLFYQSNQDFRNDVAISGYWGFVDYFGNIDELMYSANSYYTNYSNGQYASSLSTPYTTPSTSWTWTDLPTGITQVQTRWNRETLETDSNGTGPEEDPIVIITSSGPDRWETQGNEASNRHYYYYWESSGTYTEAYGHFRFKEKRAIPTDAYTITFAYSAYSEDGVSDFTNDYLKVWLYLEYI